MPSVAFRWHGTPRRAFPTVALLVLDSVPAPLPRRSTPDLSFGEGSFLGLRLLLRPRPGGRSPCRLVLRGPAVAAEEVGEHLPIHGDVAVVRGEITRAVVVPAALGAIVSPRVVEIDIPHSIFQVDLGDEELVQALTIRP